MDTLELWSKIFCYPKPPKWYKDGDISLDIKQFSKTNPYEYELLTLSSMDEDDRIVLSFSHDIPTSSSDKDLWCRIVVKRVLDDLKDGLQKIADFKIVREYPIPPNSKNQIDFENNVLKIYLLICWWRKMYNKLLNHKRTTEDVYEGYTEYSLPNPARSRANSHSTQPYGLSVGLSTFVQSVGYDALSKSLPAVLTSSLQKTDTTPSMTDFVSGKVVPKDKFVIMELFTESQMVEMVTKLGLEVRKGFNEVDIANTVVLGINRVVRRKWIERKLAEIQYCYGQEFLLEVMGEINATEFEYVKIEDMGYDINPVKYRKHGNDEMISWCEENIKEFMRETPENYIYKIQYYYSFNAFRPRKCVESWDRLYKQSLQTFPHKWKVRNWRITDSGKFAYGYFVSDKGIPFGAIIRKRKKNERCDEKFFHGDIIKVIGLSGNDYTEIFLYLTYKGIYHMVGKVGDLPDDGKFEIIE
jgi:hypothetical protein